MKPVLEEGRFWEAAMSVSSRMTPSSRSAGIAGVVALAFVLVTLLWSAVHAPKEPLAHLFHFPCQGQCEITQGDELDEL
jgi:hypothetical protein